MSCIKENIKANVSASEIYLANSIRRGYARKRYTRTLINQARTNRSLVKTSLDLAQSGAEGFYAPGYYDGSQKRSGLDALFEHPLFR